MMKTIPKLPFLFISLCLMSAVAMSQTVDGFDKLNPAEFEQWKKKEGEKFQKFKDERDQAFTEFLKRQWREMQLMQGIIPDEKPKPIKMPVYTPPAETPSRPIPGGSPLIENLPIPQPPPEVQPELPPPPPLRSESLRPEVQKGRSTLHLTFCDTPLTIPYDERLKAPFGHETNKEAISGFWEALSRANYEDFLRQAQSDKDQMQLNDWGYCLLLNTIAESLYPGRQNPSHLFVWFMLSKSGYVAKIGYDADRVYLLLPSVNTVYGVPYAKFADDSHRFYAVSFDSQSKPASGSLYTYDGTYPGADRLMNLKLERSPNIGNQVVRKTLTFSYQDQDYTLLVTFNQNVVDFFKDYPSTDLAVYFDASLSPEARFSLFTALRPILEGKSEIEAVNILLRFVQTAFAYQTDGEQFGREKAFFPEELFFYDASDCEDRSILFAYLVRTLMALDVIGLDYPGHIATAVKLRADVSGDAVIYRNQRYVICDPTYINADAGTCMPQFQHVNPSVIAIGR